MALVPDQKFSTFQDGGSLIEDDIVVGLRNGINTKFTYGGVLPPGYIVSIAQGGTGASNAPLARANLGLGTMAVQDAASVNITGGTAALTTGSVASSPVNPTDLVNKAYADAISAGLFVEDPVLAATTANIVGTYNNGASGVGATITVTANGAASIDGVALSLNDRVLIKDQSTTFQNGIYTVTDAGSVSTQAIYTRAAEYDQPSDIDPGDLVIVRSGNVNGGSSWIETATVTTIGTSPILFSIFTQTIPLASSPNLVMQSDANGKPIWSTQTLSMAGALSYGGAYSMVGAFTFQGTLTGNTAVTYPTSGTLATTAQVITGTAVQKFTSGGTYTPNAKMLFCMVEVCGGGGGGGGAQAAASQAGAGGGGGAGGYSRSFLSRTTVGAGQTITIGTGGSGGALGLNAGGAGGTSSFGSLVTANGGGGGPGAATTAATQVTVGGLGAPVGTGQVASSGEPGGTGIVTSGSVGQVAGGNGASNFFGGGGRSTGVATPPPGTGYGSGGAGGLAYNGVASVGGAGAPGLVIITEYLTP